MKNLKVLLILINFVFLGCNDSVTNQLTKEDNVWYIFTEKKVNSFENINYAYCFYPNGKLDYQIYDFSTDSLRSFRMNDVKQLMRWDYENEQNILKIENKKYKIIKFEEDTLVLKYINSNKKRILINLRNKNPTTFKSVVN